MQKRSMLDSIHEVSSLKNNKIWEVAGLSLQVRPPTSLSHCGLSVPSLPLLHKPMPWQLNGAIQSLAKKGRIFWHALITVLGIPAAASKNKTGKRGIKNLPSQSTVDKQTDST